MKPRCSIVIPVHNRAGMTRRCLDALNATPPDVPVEIVVVDDASSDATASLLESYGARIRIIRMAENSGFSRACNAGAAAASGEYLVFLNNDTVPLAGWLDELVTHSEAVGASVVGSKLLFPNDTIQHAGVVVCTDGNPRHIYAGFPADHPVVNRSRQFQAVTAASMLVRRSSFEQLGGFDPAFLNGLEDVDLCLRLGERGETTYYCHRSVVYHLESVSRGRRSDEIRGNAEVFRDRWQNRARADELEHYMADGMLTIRHRDTYPIGIDVSPELGTPFGAAAELSDELLAASSQQVAELLRETVRLTSVVAELELSHEPPGVGLPRAESSPRVATRRSADALQPTCDRLLQRAAELELEILELQCQLADARRSPGGHDCFQVSDYLEYRGLIGELRAVVDKTVPPAATVAVVSRGDEQLTRLADRRVWHLPQTEDGTYLGHHPGDSDEAIVQLEALRQRGAEYLVLPRPSLWWLEHYGDFAQHLMRRYRALVQDDSVCHVFQLWPTTRAARRRRVATTARGDWMASREMPHAENEARLGPGARACR